MSFSVKCASCGAVLRAKVKPSVDSVDCPKCNAVISLVEPEPVRTPQMKMAPDRDDEAEELEAVEDEPERRRSRRRRGHGDEPEPTVVVVERRLVGRIIAWVRIAVWALALLLIVMDYGTGMRLATNNVQYIQFIGNMIFVYCCARAVDFMLRSGAEV